MLQKSLPDTLGRAQPLCLRPLRLLLKPAEAYLSERARERTHKATGLAR